MNYNKMSVAIPYHGRADFFKETLDCLYNQTCKNFEVVIGDDSSNEKDIQDLKDLVTEYKQKGLEITVIRTKADLGAIKNTEQAVKACKNEIIRILHTDDCIAPSAIEFELSIFNEKPDTFFAFHNASVFRKHFIPNETGKWSDETWIENWLKNKNYTHSILPSCFVFKKEVLDEVGFFNPDFEFMYDWEYQIRLFEYSFLNNKRVVEIQPGYVGWRISETQESYTKCLVCYKDSRKTAKVLEESYKKIGKLLGIKKKKIRRFKRIFDKRLEYESVHNNVVFQIPIKFKIKKYYRKFKKFIFSKERKGDYFLFKIFGLHFKCGSKDKKLCRKTMKSLKKLPVPFIGDKRFIYYTEYPVYAEDVTIESSFIQAPKTAVIIQGPIIKNNNFTFETVLIYKQIFKNQNVEIILSTWSDEDKEILNKMKQLGIHIVQSDRIEYPGRGNVNYQIISTREGILKAEELNCEYILKSRSDQRIYKTDIIEFLLNMIKQFPLNSNVSLKNRIIACSFNTFIYRLYGISDMFLFGKTEDIKKYWDISFDNLEVSEWSDKTDFELFKIYSPESFIARQFLQNIGHNPADTIEDSLLTYSDYFIFVDKETLKLYWPKYSNKSCRWEAFYPSWMEMFSFLDWFNLYSNKEKVKYYCSKNWKELPEKINTTKK